MRALLAVAGFLALGACNVVMTKDPLFKPADSAGAPTLRTGVWEFFKEPGCEVDESKPLADWPDCSGGGLVEPGDVAGPKANAPKGVLERTPYVLAAGDPRIAQVEVTVDTQVSASAEASGGAQAEAKGGGSAEARPWGYAAVRPTRFDAEGHITAFVSWPVLCGPPPPKNRKGEDVALGTLHPFRGMEMKPGEAICTTHSIEALRAAARASEAFTDKPLHQSRWIRDGAS